MSLTAEIHAQFSATQTAEVVGGESEFKLGLDHALAFANGTLANQADILWSSGTLTLGPSANQTIDIRGVLTDAMGISVVTAELVAIMVVADPDNINDVVVGNAANPVALFSASTATISVKPGGVFLLAAPGAAGQGTIGAGATDELKILNSAGGTSVQFSVTILGRTA